MIVDFDDVNSRKEINDKLVAAQIKILRKLYGSHTATTATLAAEKLRKQAELTPAFRLAERQELLNKHKDLVRYAKLLAEK